MLPDDPTLPFMDQYTNYQLPKGTRISRMLVFDAFKEGSPNTVERQVVETLNNIMGDDQGVLGFQTSEEGRLRTAWMMESRYRRSAAHAFIEARFWQYSIAFISLVTTIISTLLSWATMTPKYDAVLPDWFYWRPCWNWKVAKILQLICAGLPLVTTLLVSANSSGSISAFPSTRRCPQHDQELRSI